MVIPKPEKIEIDFTRIYRLKTPGLPALARRFKRTTPFRFSGVIGGVQRFGF